MASTEKDLRRQVREEREELADAVVTLRSVVRSKIPLAVAGAAGFLFVVSGGPRATVRLLFRRNRH
jgi:hypothetical protein